MFTTPDPQNPHKGQPILAAGAKLEQAKAAVIMLHGRGAGPHDILGISAEYDHPNFAYVAPAAYGYEWYPQRFIAPIAQNEPALSSALGVIADLVAHIIGLGIPQEKIILMGFSQGACLALEYAARHPGRYGAVVGLSGGLIGPLGMTFNYPGSMENTPVFLGCSDVDFHIPVQRVHESAEIFSKLGAKVDKRIYVGMDHTVNQEEIFALGQLMESTQPRPEAL
jgi:predicted esterase